MSKFKAYLVENNKENKNVKIFIESTDTINKSILYSYYEVIFQLLLNDITIKSFLKVSNPLRYICNNFDDDLEKKQLDDAYTEKIINYLTLYEEKYNKESLKLIQVLENIQNQRKETIGNQLKRPSKISKLILQNIADGVVKLEKTKVKDKLKIKSAQPNKIVFEVLKDAKFENLNKNDPKEEQKEKVEKDRVIIK